MYINLEWLEVLILAGAFLSTHILCVEAVKALVSPTACAAPSKHWRLFTLRYVLTGIYIFTKQPVLLLKRCTFMQYLSQQGRFCYLSHMRKIVL